MSFRRHLLSTIRNSKRVYLRDVAKIIGLIPDGAADIQKRGALDLLEMTHWVIMSDTTGTPPADPDQVERWALGDPERLLRDAREFLTREGDLAASGGEDAQKAFAEMVLEKMDMLSTRRGNIHEELLQTAEVIRRTLPRKIGSSDVASADIIVIPMREILGLDGNPDAKGPAAGDTEVARTVCKSIAAALKLEREQTAEMEATPSMGPR